MYALSRCHDCVKILSVFFSLGTSHFIYLSASLFLSLSEGDSVFVDSNSNGSKNICKENRVKEKKTQLSTWKTLFKVITKWNDISGECAGACVCLCQCTGQFSAYIDNHKINHIISALLLLFCITQFICDWTLWLASSLECENFVCIRAR